MPARSLTQEGVAGVAILTGAALLPDDDDFSPWGQTKADLKRVQSMG